MKLKKETINFLLKIWRIFLDGYSVLSLNYNIANFNLTIRRIFYHSLSWFKIQAQLTLRMTQTFMKFSKSQSLIRRVIIQELILCLLYASIFLTNRLYVKKCLNKHKFKHTISNIDNIRVNRLSNIIERKNN